MEEEIDQGNLQGFRDFLLKKYPKISKSQLEQVDSLIERKQAESAVKSGKIGLSDLPMDQRAGIASVLPEDYQEKSAEEKTRNKKVSEAAKNYLDTYQQLSSKGDLTSKDAKRELAFVAGRYNAIAGFGEGGKALTASEIGILAPTLIKTQRQREQNVWENITGFQPELTLGLLEEDPATAAEKMKIALQHTKPELLEQYQNIGQPAGQQTNAPQGKSFGGLAQNVAGNTKDILNSLLGLPGQISGEMGNRAGQVMQNPQQALQQQFSPQNIMQSIDPTQYAKPIASEANQLLGQPLQGGDVVGRMLNRAYEKPVTTGLDLLPFLSMAKGAQASKAGAIPKTGAVPNQNVAQGIRGKALTSVAVPDMESVVRSETLMNDVIKMTKSNSVRGIARELEQFNPKAGNLIEKGVMKMDKAIGPQALDDIKTEVMAKIANSSPAQANPQLLNKVDNMLNTYLDAGELSQGIGRGQFRATSFTRMNDARMGFNKGISNSWFTNNKPMVSNTDVLNSLKWEASKAIRDVMVNSDESGKLGRVIDLQHTALETIPVISKAALKNTSSAFLNKIILDNFNKLITGPKIAGLRATGGKEALLDEILASSPVRGAQQNVTQQMVLNPARKPLPSNIVENALSKAPKPQLKRLLRDMRYKQGNWTPRQGQENLLNMLSKRKYK